MEGAPGENHRKAPKGTSLNKCKRQCFDFCKKAAQEAHTAMLKTDPELYKALQEIARNFMECKRIQAEKADCMDYLSLLYCKMLYEVA